LQGFATVEAKFHRRVQGDLDEILRKYHGVSHQLGEDFFAEFQIGIKKAVENPRSFHFDRSGLRRCNLDRFPYHFLYDLRGEYIRIWVLRHNRRNPEFGLKRFSA
jgi:plasmid stabilization system protein ParE